MKRRVFVMVTWAEFQNLNTVKRPSDLARAMASDLISFFFFFFFFFWKGCGGEGLLEL